MIAYEELCRALDRFNGRLRNEAEMKQLDSDDEAPTSGHPQQDAAGGTWGSLDSSMPEMPPDAGGETLDPVLLHSPRRAAPEPGPPLSFIAGEIGAESRPKGETTEEVDLEDSEVVEDLVDLKK